MNPLNWTAGPFLSLYLTLMLSSWALLLLARAYIGRGNPARNNRPLDPVAAAYLAGGPDRAADTVLVALFEAGAIQRHEHGGGFALSANASLPAWLQPYGGAVQATPRLSRARFQSAQAASWRALQAELHAGGLSPAPEELANYRLTGLIFVALLAAFALCKIFLGLARGHPVGYLTSLLLITIVGGTLLTSRAPYRTRAGAAALADLKSNNQRAARAPLPEELAFAFALSGAAILAGKPYRGFFTTPGIDGGSGGTGCSGGGGGGCGGGCGGCS